MLRLTRLLLGSSLVTLSLSSCSSTSTTNVTEPAALGGNGGGSSLAVAGQGGRSVSSAGAASDSSSAGNRAGGSLGGSAGVTPAVSGAAGHVQLGTGGATSTVNAAGATVTSSAGATVTSSAGTTVTSFGGAVSIGGTAGAVSIGGTAGAAGALTAPTVIAFWDFSATGSLNDWRLQEETAPALGQNAVQTSSGSFCSASGCAEISTTFGSGGSSLAEVVFFIKDFALPTDLSGATVSAKLRFSGAGFRTAHLSAYDDEPYTATDGNAMTGLEIRPSDPSDAILTLKLPAAKLTATVSPGDGYSWAPAGLNPALINSIGLSINGAVTNPGPVTFWIDWIKISR